MRTRSEKARETAIAQVSDWLRGWREWLKNLRSFSFGRKLGLWRIWRRSKSEGFVQLHIFLDLLTLSILDMTNQ